MGFIMRVAILPWGDPKNWRYVEYCFEDSCVRGFSTLALLTASPRIRPDAIIIYVLDTLLEDPECRDYKSLTSRILDYVRNYLCVGEGHDIVVEVLPGIMRKKGEPEFVFKANPNDTKLKLLHHTYKEILKRINAKPKDDSLEILVDTTHGVNYFTILVREAVFEVSSMLAARGEDVKVVVFNSDPFTPADLPGRSSDPCIPKDGGATIKIEYNVLYEVSVRPWDLAKYLRYSGESAKKLLTDVRRCGVNQDLMKELIDFSKKVVASYRVGALVELLTLARERPEATQDLNSLIDEVLRCWGEMTRLEWSGENLCRTSFFTKLQDGFRLLMHAHAILSGVRELVNLHSSITLKEVEKAKNTLLRGSEITGVLVDREIGTIERLARDSKVPEDWTTYSKILEEVEEACTNVKNSINLDRTKRNFIAHTGFLKDCLEVRKKEHVELKIREECKDTINKILDEIFRELTK